MAVVEMCDTTIPKLVPPFLRYIQYDAIAIDLTDEQFAGLQAGLSKLSGSRQPCDNKKRIEAKKLKEVFEKGTGGGTTESCRAILTKSQYQDLLEYLQENEYLERNSSYCMKRAAINSVGALRSWSWINSYRPNALSYPVFGDKNSTRGSALFRNFFYNFESFHCHRKGLFGQRRCLFPGHCNIIAKLQYEVCVFLSLLWMK